MSADTENKWLLKHTGSSLRDSYVIVKIDEETKTVELISEQFDRALLHKPCPPNC